MPTIRRLTALALARAMLAGRPSVDGLAARLCACVGTRSAWQRALAERAARLPGEQWQRLTVRSLADWIERDTDYGAAWRGQEQERPCARRYILRESTRLQPPPVGLETCLRPHWPTTAALATWLGITNEGLWRLTKPAAWQRRAPMGEQHCRYALKAKRSGGWRLLEVPAPYLMALQRRLLDMLIAHQPPHEAACGYRRGQSVLDHARAHAGQAVVLKFDLRDFFSSVRASRVHALFATLGYPEAVARAMTALCTTATPEPVLRRLREDGSLNWEQAQRLRDAHLPQGAPTSPALANLCAFSLDLRLDGLAHVLGARYTRYADDIILSGGASLSAVRQRIEIWVARIAREEGFVLNHRKTRCLPAAQRQEVCGVVVNRHPNLPRDEFDRLKAILHQCVMHGPSSQNRSGVDHWREYLHGRVAWAAQLNAGKATRLQRLLAHIDWCK
jgi:RNA-directed DNA polymerase